MTEEERTNLVFNWRKDPSAVASQPTKKLFEDYKKIAQIHRDTAQRIYDLIKRKRKAESLEFDKISVQLNRLTAEWYALAMYMSFIYDSLPTEEKNTEMKGGKKDDTEN
ncbi:MAG: hypothetical protein ACOC56_04365 [Atribacterota bacterium]